jgi:hypothetical protein
MLLVPNLLPKVVSHSGSRLLLGLIVRPHRRVVEGQPPPSASRKPGRPALLSESEVHCAQGAFSKVRLTCKSRSSEATTRTSA